MSALAGWSGGEALAQVLPAGGAVAAGDAQIGSSGANMIVSQSSDAAIINWQSFNIGAGASVTFQQPGASARTLNRVSGDAASVLSGSLFAPGAVYLINPNGIGIANGAVINTGSFVASTLGISDENFLAGNLTFERGGAPSSVVNRGVIRVADGGTAALLGSAVVNEGVIEARYGRVALASGDLITIDLAGDGFLSVGASAEDLEGMTDAFGRPLEALVRIDGSTQADGGRVYVTAGAAEHLVLNAVRISGEVRARSVARASDGTILLGGVRIDGAEGAVAITGQIDVSGGGSIAGGAISIAGDDVALGGALRADGAAGGQIMVSAADRLSIAHEASARGATGAGGSVSYAGGSIIENSASSTDVSGATGGSILVAAADGLLTSGAYRAAGLQGSGGQIALTGDAVTLLSTELDARGVTRGGLVRVGGDFQGGRDSRTQSELFNGFEGRFGDVVAIAQARETFLNDGVRIDVSSSHGAGGAAVVWSSQQTTALGQINAQGLTGGFVELSSAGTLRHANLAGVNAGQGGNLLLDPKNVVIGDYAAASDWTYAVLLGNGVGPSSQAVAGLDGGDTFGSSVALNSAGTLMAVGAPGDDGVSNGVGAAGAVHLFSFTNGDFGGAALEGVIGSGYVGTGNLSVALGTVDLFGASLALNGAGDRLVVGAPFDDGFGDGMFDSGAVYMFTFTSGSTFDGAALAGRIGHGYVGSGDIDVALGAEDRFGSAVSLNDATTRLAIGAPRDDGFANDRNDSGAVRIYSFANGSFGTPLLSSTIGFGYVGANDLNAGFVAADDLFGTSVSFNAAGDRLAVGAPFDDGGSLSLSNSGSVHLFTISGLTPSRTSTIGYFFFGVGELHVGGLDVDDRFGTSVALNDLGDRLVVGAPNDDGEGNATGNAGAVRIFRFSDGNFSNPTQELRIGAGYAGAGDLDIAGLAANSELGYSLSLNGLGDRMAAGARGFAGEGGVLLFTSTPNALSSLFFGDSTGQTVNVSRAALAATLAAGTNVTIEASNDLTVEKDINVDAPGAAGDLTLYAGRSVLLGASSITTDGGDLTLMANAPASAGVVDADRDAGAAVISMSGGSINAGSGAVSITLADGAGNTNSTSGDITLGSISAASITAHNQGLTAGSDVVINAGATLTTTDAGAALLLASESGTITNGGVLNPTNGGWFAGWADDPALATEGATGYAKRYNVADFATFLTNAGAAGQNYFAYRIAPTLTVSASYSPGSKVYGEADPAISYNITGLIDGDTQATALSGAAARAAGESVGFYSLNAGSLASLLGYTFVPAANFSGGTLQITQRPITITADSGQGKVYGELDPALTYAITSGSLAFSDALTGGLARAGGENVGGYAIGQGTLAANANYAVTYVGSTFNITQRPITITADSGQGKVYGELDPALTYAITSGSLAFSDALSGALSRAGGENVGFYAIGQGSLAAGANYAVTYVGANFEITQRPITVTVDSGQGKIYGELDPALTYAITSGSLAFSDTLSGNIARAPGENVGGYAIGQGTLGANSNYAFTFVGSTFNIAQRAITITADPGQNKVYGDLDSALTYAITSGSLAFSDALSGDLTRVAGENVGFYAISQGSLTAGGNYLLTYVGANFEITQRPITVTADPISRVYGETDPLLTYLITSGSLAFSDTLSGDLARAPGENVGNYAIGQGTLSAGGNYALTFVGANFSITQRALTVTADAQSRIYGDADPLLTYLITSGSLAFSDSLSGALSRAPGENVGNYAIGQGSLTAGGNYALTFVGANFEITQRSITVTADPISRIYGDADPLLTYLITSGSLAFSDALSGGLARAAGENVGLYAIGQGTLTAGGNYALTYVGANFEITQRPITVTADGQSRIYGDADPLLTYLITSGSMAFSDTLSGALTRAAGEDVGSYAIGQGTLTAGGNYALTFIGDTLIITPRALTVTADPLSRIYGDADPALTYAITSGSLAFSDTLSGALSRVAGEDVGSYAIGQGSLIAGGNYDLTFVGANLVITPRPITIAADGLSRIYGDADPALTYQIASGDLVFGDTLSGALSRAAGESVGSYAIGQGSLAAGANYDVTFVGASLVITPRPITVTANSLSRVYGDADPALTYAITSGSLAFSDTLSGALARDAGDNVGSYAIGQGSLAASSNYALTYVGGSFVITPRPIQVTADDLSKTFGAPDPLLTWAITGGSLVSGDSLLGALARANGELPGVYVIGIGSLANPNYAISFANGALTITGGGSSDVSVVANENQSPPDGAIFEPFTAEQGGLHIEAGGSCTDETGGAQAAAGVCVAQ